ncbi:hypothetical protein [Oceanobacillus manasiensis]|uniref:hypothetical protein n=1 Tax=Oceanobacillus manasiensis TaxID=586413 RepID=UPI000A91B9C6|nr:hypothetical protein [Oceanobacillus manasiensis]
MVVPKKKILKNWIVLFALVLIVVVGSLYYVYFFTPKNSLELYQELAFAESFEEAEGLTLDGYEANFKEEDFNFIQANTADSVRQFSLFDYKDKSYVVMTSPGTEKLKVLAVEELPDDIRKFFRELPK